MEGIPPTKAALLQHTKRAVYQGGLCWGKMYDSCKLYAHAKARKTGDGPILQTGNLFGQIFQRPACHLEN